MFGNKEESEKMGEKISTDGWKREKILLLFERRFS